MSKKYYKTVLMPIEVSVGHYCWECSGIEGRICGHFDNSEYKNPQCGLGFTGLKEGESGAVRKPDACKNLKKQKVEKQKKFKKVKKGYGRDWEFWNNAYKR